MKKLKLLFSHSDYFKKLKPYNCHYKKIGLAFFILLFFLQYPDVALSQDRCGTVQYELNRKRHNPFLEKDEDFESWMARNIALRRVRQRSNGTEGTESSIVQIPVVVHIIHNGEAIGTGTNIPDAQVISQIEVLTEDFRRLNTDANQTPADFLPVAVDAEIEFVLAKRDPEGLPTNGIVRVQGTQSLWDMADNNRFKSLSYWPAEDYLNIWVVDLRGGLLGYAQFPVSSLEGLEQASANRLTDGAVVDYQHFGSNAKGTFPDLDSNFDRGRTTTHEVGHFFGLRHIWGDGGCSLDDFVDDTPLASGSTSGCPSHPQTSCGGTQMFQNYMDYTYDECMNLFTSGQKLRMRTVLDNSPRRASLLNSKGAIAPSTFALDLGLRNVLDPSSQVCAGEVAPILEVRNYGTDQLTSTRIRFSMDGFEQETLDFNFSLNNLEITNIAFSPVTFLDGGIHDLQFEILEINGTGDENADNDMIDISVDIPASSTLPLAEEFANIPIDWTITNVDQGFTWELKSAPSITPGNQAMFINFFDYENVGEEDIVATPVFDLTSTPIVLLSFDLAYAKFPNRDNDGLTIAVSTDCGLDYSTSDIVYQKFGDDLSTTNETTFPYTPGSRDDWRSELIDLQQYVGEENVRLLFIAQNGFGNNIYLDNVAILTDPENDVAISGVDSPSLISCTDDFTPTIRVENTGTVDLTSFDVEYTLDNVETSSLSFTDLLLTPGRDATFILPDFGSLSEGGHDLSITLSNPNGNDEINTSNNTLDYSFVIDRSEDVIPLRETFNDFNTSSWAVLNPDNDRGWEILNIGDEPVIYLNGFEYETVGQEDWLVSPTLDFSNTTEASLFFDASYGYSGSGSTEFLKVLVSIDCGQTYEAPIYQRLGGQIAVNSNVTGAWFPNQDSANHWRREFINLNAYAGQEEVRVAFVVTNSNNNNLFLYNIEFFVSDNPFPADVSDRNFLVFPNNPLGNRFNPGTLNIAFSLPQKERVELRLIDRVGNLIVDSTIEDVLNQTYEFKVPTLSHGIYILQVRGESFLDAERVFITQ
ncbi:MAG: choice-of-anchor J domain-containing protein [Bacteroidota bacterium]